MSGYVNAVYNACYGIGCYIFSYIDSKKETTPLICLSCIGCGLLVGSLPLFPNFVWYYVVMVFAGVLYGFISTYMLARLLPKCRIMGESNNALFFRENASNMSVVFAITFGVFGSMTPVLICSAVAILLSAAIIPLNEEKTRKLLIKYLQNHEKAMRHNDILHEMKKEDSKEANSNGVVVVNLEKRKKSGARKGKSSKDKK